jgi:hypothetical protein
MMGRQRGGQKPLFYSFNLDDHVPPDHLLRGIDQFLDLSELHQHLAPYYSHTVRPSIDPQLLIRILIVGYCFGIRSERQLCEEVHLNLAYRWFCRLGLEDQCRTTRRSPRIGMAGSVIATRCASCSSTFASLSAAASASSVSRNSSSITALSRCGRLNRISATPGRGVERRRVVVIVRKRCSEHGGWTADYSQMSSEVGSLCDGSGGNA